jgi:uncharacterized membrane protein (DUF106 family)
MNLEDKRKQLEEHTTLPFPSMERLADPAEFAALDADIVGEVQSIVGKGRDGFEHLQSYKDTIKEFQEEAEQKQLVDVITYLDSLNKLLD